MVVVRFWLGCSQLKVPLDWTSKVTHLHGLLSVLAVGQRSARYSPSMATSSLTSIVDLKVV